MPQYATSDLDVAQKACVLAGMKKPSSFQQLNSTEAIVANDIYEDMVRDALCIVPWNFATAEVILTSLNATPPLTRYAASYAIPVDIDIVRIKTVRINGTLWNYAKQGQNILVNSYPIGSNTIPNDTTSFDNDEVTMEYIYRVDEVDWPPYFTMYCILRLAALFAGAIARNGALATELGGEAEKALVRGRTINGQEDTAKKMWITKIRSTRLGGRPTR